MNFIYSNKSLDSKLAKDFNNLKHFKNENLNLLINDFSCITESENLLSVTNGYLKDSNKVDVSTQNISAVQHTYNNWPVDDNITGSFSTVIINKNNFDLVLCTDLTNIYPLYYKVTKNAIFISNSIVLLGRYSNSDLDKTGIFQRSVGPNFQNIGSRTILKDCKSLLPGQWIKFNTTGSKVEKRFDNSLYQNLSSPHFEKSMLSNYWNQYKIEVDLCTSNFNHTNIALSGGIDSRIVLGAIENKEISAFTYGDSKNYESKVARKLAIKKNAKHKCFFDLDLYFPKPSILSEYCRETESVKLNSWLEILENIKPKIKEPILLGELCEGLPGRNIKRFSSSKFRNKNFIRYYIKNENFTFQTANSVNFAKWKETKTEFILSWHDDNWFKKLGFESRRDEIISNTISDINEIFERIASHNLPFEELYDELFSWYTFTRMELSRQVNICNEKFYAFSPGMSIQLLKKTSNIHPNLRLYYRFANKLLNETTDLKKFSNIPTSQIPLLPQNSSNIFKIPVWGIRSRIDEWLVKRLMKVKDPSKPYRLFKSINWIKIYQHPTMLENIENYYRKNHLSSEYYQTFYNLAEKRKNMKSWPFANMDIMSGAALNSELDLIKNYPK